MLLIDSFNSFTYNRLYQLTYIRSDWRKKENFIHSHKALNILAYWYFFKKNLIIFKYIYRGNFV
jgi:hypothetical protein